MLSTFTIFTTLSAHVSPFPSASEKIVSYSSIGVVIEKNDIGVNIVQVLDNSPAFHASLLVGGRIWAVEQKPVSDLPITEIVSLIRGEIGSSVIITLHRGDEVLDITVERGLVQEP